MIAELKEQVAKAACFLFCGKNKKSSMIVQKLLVE